MLAISFGVFMNFVYAFSSTGRIRTRDEFLPTAQIESLLEHGSTAIPQALGTPWFYGTLDKFGRPQAPYPPGQSIASIPWFVLGRYAAKHLPGVPMSARLIITDFFQVLSNSAFAALAVGLMLFTFARVGVPIKESVLAAAMIGLSTSIGAYSGWYFSEPLATAFVIGAGALLFAIPRSQSISPLCAVLAGLAIGCALWVRPTQIIILPIFVAAIFFRDARLGVKSTICFLVPSMLLALALLWRNSELFGTVWNFGYPVVVDGKLHTNSFRGSFLKGFIGLTLSPGKSFLLYSPPLIVGLWGIRRLWLRDRGLTVLAGCSVPVYLLFFAKYMQWEGGYCYGPRYLVPSVALSGLLIGPALANESKSLRRLALLTFSLGLAVQALGLATNFLETQQTGDYYDSQYNYRMSYLGVFAQLKQLFHYASLTEGSPIGVGFDRWWIFLAKAGVARSSIIAIGLTILTCLGGSYWWFLHTYERAILLEDQARSSN